MLCVMYEHRGHDTVSAAAERTEKQKQLGATQSKFQQRIQEREKELQDLRQAVQSLKRSAQAAVGDSERIFTEMIRSIERRCSEVKELIRDQEKAEVSPAEGVLERLEQEIAELRRRDAELEQLSHTEDHIHFLQSCQSLCAPPGPGDLPSITVSPHISFEAVRKSVSELKEQLEGICAGELSKISQTVGNIHLLKPRTTESRTIESRTTVPRTTEPRTTVPRTTVPRTTEPRTTEPRTTEPRTTEPRTTEPRTTDSSTIERMIIQSRSFKMPGFGFSGPKMKLPRDIEPKTREDFLQYSCGLTLDPDTAHRNLRLSEGNREVIRVREIQPYPDHPKRFDSSGVLCREGLSGRCYWEAEWSGGSGVDVAVSYKDISRKGKGSECSLGWNKKSWSLLCSPSSYSFLHNKESTDIPVPPSSRIGVYLDHRAGTLSFYSISDTMTLLHTVQTTFTQPLYPGFKVWGSGSSLKLCDLG
ncbi:hypothetical protein COCON_G00071130 [Conger conger]|uniref:B30.2/SPRY domain-containing protein n=1 Tax=Conger conger TaxID=82655 RepID=A0A9Q1DTD8_CONCO|nr:hypothetical protein COCON_G00071130 [Conger conger]